MNFTELGFTDVFLMMMSAILVENFIFSKFYGCCPFLGVSDSPDKALGMGMAVTFVMTLSSAVTWAVYYLLLLPRDLTYLKTVAFILVIAALVQLIEMFLRKFVPARNIPAAHHHELRGAWRGAREHSGKLRLYSVGMLRLCRRRGLYARHCDIRGRACKT